MSGRKLERNYALTVLEKQMCNVKTNIERTMDTIDSARKALADNQSVLESERKDLASIESAIEELGGLK